MSRVSTVFALICFLSLTGATRGHGHGADVKVVVMEGHYAILPCSPSTKTNMESKLFDWKKDGHMEVFMYDAGDYYSDDFAGQDEQFKGRVSHFPDELKFGNASIMINNTKMADSGNYTCAFPRLQPAGQIYNIELVVEPTFKDRAGEISGASPKPYVSICKVTDVGVKLRCEVQEAFPRPKLQWQDSDGNDLRAEETQVSERDGRYSVILQTTVTPTSTNCFHCVAKQEKINHVVTAEITVPEKLFEDKTTWFLFGWLSGVLTVAPLTAFLAMKYFQNRRKKGPDEEKKPLPNGVSQEGAPLNEVNV